MSHTHEAGWAHASGALRGPSWLREPSDPNELVEQLWSRTATKSDGVLSVGGVALTDLVAEHGSPAYVLDEVDFRARAGAFRDAFAGFDVYYAGKAFLCTAVARWVAEEGLHLDVCTGGEMAVAERAGFPMERVGFHGNNKSVAELERAVRSGVGRVIIDSFEEVERLAEVSRAHGTRTAVMIRVTAGVEAHTHEYIATAHEDQKFGFSITSGDALEAVRRVLASDALELRGLHSHIGSQIFDTAGFEVAARRVLALHARVATELGTVMPEMDLGGG
ncbi:MAG: diaminopimelate decarboxylase family protein, partial [Nocardioides sp.]